MDADYKVSSSQGNRQSMAEKIHRSIGELTSRKKKGRHGGFVPNFSPLSDAFNAEKAMGGKPALDYDPRVGLYVRDDRTQKGLSDVIRDHPEGLTTAIRNSKAIQGKSKGHVPNFAEGATGFDMAMITAGMMGFGFGLNDLKEKLASVGPATQELQQKLNDAADAAGNAKTELQAAAEEQKKASGKKKTADNKVRRLEGQRNTAERKLRQEAEQTVLGSKEAKSGALGKKAARGEAGGRGAKYQEAIDAEVARLKGNNRMGNKESKAARAALQAKERELQQAKQRQQQANADLEAAKRNTRAKGKHTGTLIRAERALARQANQHNQQVSRGTQGTTVTGRGVRGTSRGRGMMNMGQQGGMGGMMMIVMLLFMWGMYKDRTKNFIILGVGAFVFALALWLVRSQTTVDDTEYMAAMIPHHSIAIMTSERASLKDPRVRELAQAIIVAQRREIAEMKYLIDDIEQNGPRSEERLPEEMQQ